jgi:uncharacterized protein YdaU (DUF1376 family)
MHYFQFNIGDYQSHTAHLEPLEDIAYRRMLDWCYLHEKPLPDDVGQISRYIRMRSHTDCITSVLHEFFERTPDGWWKDRIGIEISKATDKSVKAKASADVRWGKAKDAIALPAQSESNATHNTLHITQIKEANASLSGTKFPDCPQQEILDLWQKHLPHLTQHRVWEGTRRATLRARWVQASKPSAYSPEGYKTRQDGLAWWDELLGYIAKDTRLAAGFETNGRVWKPDLEWVINATNFQKIIDGKYTK